MLLITTMNGLQAVIRPTPLVSITCTPIKNKTGILGASYDIVLTGTILADEGSPFSNGNHTNNYVRPNSEAIAYLGSSGPGDLPRLESILTKQNSLRELFALEGSRFEFTPVNSPKLVFYPKLVTIAFEEGIYVNTCNYTVTLRADSLLYNDNRVHIDSSFAPNGYNVGKLTELELIDRFGGLVEDFSETWSVEVDEGIGETRLDLGPHNPRTYRLTRNLSATGRDGFIPSGNSTARLYGWLEARNFLKKAVITNDANGGSLQYPNYTLGSSFSDYVIGLTAVYSAANHTRTENIDKTAGTFNITDTWLLTSGIAYENYNLSLNTSIDNPFVSVSINGTIKGLSSISSSGSLYGGLTSSEGIASPFDNAKAKFLQISNNGTYGLSSYIYKRACNAANTTLNSQPKSITLGVNEFAGEITYNLEYDNRPTNFISGVLSEVININDTYPGDVFAVIPVLGRTTGPVLQYIGGRTEYRRDVGIELLLDYTDIPYSSGRNPLLLSKPSLREPIRSQLNTVIKQVSPAYEPGIRKYFLNPPTESWNPKEGRYSINLSWVYELDH